MPFRIRHKLTTALIVLFVIAFIAAFIIQKTDYHFSANPAFKKVERGMTRAQVQELLGPPQKDHVMTGRYDISYKLKGYTFRAFTQAGSVLIYPRGKEVCYVLLVEDRVSDVALGHQ